MNIHEYQAKAILADYGVRLPQGGIADSPEAAEQLAEEIGGRRWVLKAQVLAGDRGPAGGVRFATSPEAVRKAAEELIGQSLVTAQTGPQGYAVRKLWVEEAIEHDRSVYVAVLVDRSRGQVALIGARSGGEDIEERAARDPALIASVEADPVKGFSANALKTFATKLALEGRLAEAAAGLFLKLHKAFVELDASLIEINPLAVTPQRELIALDVKMAFDDNALFRHPEIAQLHDPSDGDPDEREAQRHEMNYVKLDGDIGVVVNGAGLALASLDMLIDAGGKAANFMDIRPEASSRQIAEGISLLLANPKVKVVLVNVYGGGLLPCDTVADGIATALKRGERKVPLVFRAAGSNAKLARERLRNYGIPFLPAADMGEAVRLAVETARKEAA
ncbi:MAG TPA: ADP-forming succinate--CoA ligase subunit beta [Hyphomicrobiales bacterium]|nr:ADP-forming succinate--CoA ligase subunit beta [Hyphomicrobiales bacterium]